MGANVTISNGTFKIVINAKPLIVANKEKATAEDATSIFENGLLSYKFPANPLVQTLAQAQDIADKLLQYYKEPRRDLEMDWRGNPALMLNEIMVTHCRTTKPKRRRGRKRLFLYNQTRTRF